MGFTAREGLCFTYLLKLQLFGVKEVFAAEELRTSVTSGQYRRVEQSLTAVDVRNAVLQWPFDVHAAASNHLQRPHSKPWHKLRLGGPKGDECICFDSLCVNFEHLLRRNKVFCA